MGGGRGRGGGGGRAGGRGGDSVVECYFAAVSFVKGRVIDSGGGGGGRRGREGATTSSTTIATTTTRSAARRAAAATSTDPAKRMNRGKERERNWTISNSRKTVCMCKKMKSLFKEEGSGHMSLRVEPKSQRPKSKSKKPINISIKPEQKALLFER